MDPLTEGQELWLDMVDLLRAHNARNLCDLLARYVETREWRIKDSAWKTSGDDRLKIQGEIDGLQRLRFDLGSLIKEAEVKHG